jgi:ribose transport system substrate-binding protein
LPVLFLEGVPDHAQARKKGFMQVASMQYPDWIIIEKIADLDRIKAEEVTKDIIDTNGVPNAIFGSNDEMALGAIDALNARRVARDQWPIIVGFGATKAALEKIQEGTLSATIGQKPDEMGKTAVNWSVDLINGRQVPNEMLIPVHVISR